MCQKPDKPSTYSSAHRQPETQPIELVIQHGEHQFYAGMTSETMGFNGDYLGPTIRLYRDTDVTITFANEIDEPTTVHGHGLHVNGDIDGGPQSVIQPGEVGKSQFRLGKKPERVGITLI